MPLNNIEGNNASRTGEKKMNFSKEALEDFFHDATAGRNPHDIDILCNGCSVIIDECDGAKWVAELILTDEHEARQVQRYLWNLLDATQDQYDLDADEEETEYEYDDEETEEEEHLAPVIDIFTRRAI